MKKFLFLVLMLSAMLPTIGAPVRTVTVPAPPAASLSRQGDLLQVRITMPLSELDVQSKRAVILMPVVLADTAASASAVELPTLGVFGRQRYLYYERGSAEATADQIWPASKAPATYEYTATTPWQDWMDGCTLRLARTDYGCCYNIEGEGYLDLARLELPRPFEPRFSFLRPTADATKSRQVKGRAFIDFPVNRTEIYPDYRGNTRELAKIRATIDSVAGDKDVTVRLITIKGFASPEGSYTNNVRLAKGRTEALKEYVRNLYSFPASLFQTAYEPEDWEGLINWLQTNDIENRDAILAIATDTSLEPDPRNTKIQRDFPRQYAWLLANVYPALRHSDYTIDFDIRTFTDVDEIRRLVRTAPQKLSLNEFFLAAQACPVGSDEFNEIFDTAVRMYPDNEVANLNAANTAMQRGDLKAAAAYLAKSGDSPEAIYARGNLAALQGHNEEALQLMQQAARLKVADAPAAIEQLRRIIRLSAGSAAPAQNVINQ